MTKPFEVPYTKLNSIQEAFCLDKLVECNKLIKRWATYFGNKQQQKFRKNLFNSVKKPDLMVEMKKIIPAEFHSEFSVDCKVILAVHASPEVSLDGNTVEFAMICSYSALARKHAKKHYKQNKDTITISLGDYLDEAYISLIDCVYGYSDRAIAFSTYCWKAMKNRMNKTTNHQNAFCPLTNPHIKLVQKYEEKRKTYNDHVTFDEVTLALGLSEKDTKTLASIMAKVYNESSMKVSSNSDDNVTNDYTYLSGSARNEDEIFKNMTRLGVQNAISVANLTEFEMKVLRASMEEPWGWQTELADNNINPKTGKPYTKTWIGTVLSHAQKKVKFALKKVAA